MLFSSIIAIYIPGGYDYKMFTLCPLLYMCTFKLNKCMNKCYNFAVDIMDFHDLIIQSMLLVCG